MKIRVFEDNSSLVEEIHATYSVVSISSQCEKKLHFLCNMLNNFFKALARSKHLMFITRFVI